MGVESGSAFWLEPFNEKTNRGSNGLFKTPRQNRDFGNWQMHSSLVSFVRNIPLKMNGRIGVTHPLNSFVGYLRWVKLWSRSIARIAFCFWSVKSLLSFLIWINLQYCDTHLKWFGFGSCECWGGEVVEVEVFLFEIFIKAIAFRRVWIVIVKLKCVKFGSGVW